MREFLKRKVKVMKWTLPVWFILAIALSSSVGFAVWINGFSLTGLFTATSGSQGSAQTETWDVSLTSDDNVTNSFIYSNPDGSMLVSYELTDNITSTVGNCNYEPNKDIQFYLSYGGQECLLTEASPCDYTMVSGDNSINVTVDPHPNRCSLTGNYEISFDV